MNLVTPSHADRDGASPEPRRVPAGAPPVPRVEAGGPPAPAAPAGTDAPAASAAEKIGAWVKEFALYPFFIVLGIVGVFTLFSVLQRDDKDARDYLAEIRGGGGKERWYAAFQLSNSIARQGDDLKADAAFLQEVRELFDQSDDDDPRLQRYLAIVLGRLQDNAALPGLGRSLAADSDAETRMWSAWALGAIAAPEGVPALVGALADPDAGVREMGAYALGSLRDPRSLEPLRAALQDEAESVRWNAAIALALQGDGSGYAILRQLVNSVYLSRLEGMTDERVKETMLNAVKALGVLQASYPSARDLLEETSTSAPFPLVKQEARKQLESQAHGSRGGG